MLITLEKSTTVYPPSLTGLSTVPGSPFTESGDREMRPENAASANGIQAYTGTPACADSISARIWLKVIFFGCPKPSLEAVTVTTHRVRVIKTITEIVSSTIACATSFKNPLRSGYSENCIIRPLCPFCKKREILCLYIMKLVDATCDVTDYNSTHNHGFCRKISAETRLFADDNRSVSFYKNGKRPEPFFKFNENFRSVRKASLLPFLRI